MQERITISRPYAQAAFAVARQAGELAAWTDALAVLAMALKDPVMRALVKNPRVVPAQLLDIIVSVAGNRLTPLQHNFVQVLIDAERVDLLPEIAGLFHRYRTEAEGRVDVEITSAYPLDDAQQAKISAALRSRVGRTIELKSRTDKDLIGGAVVSINDEVIDLSVRGRLRMLAAGLN